MTQETEYTLCRKSNMPFPFLTSDKINFRLENIGSLYLPLFTTLYIYMHVLRQYLHNQKHNAIYLQNVT